MLYKILRWLFTVYFNIFYKVKVYGADNIPSSGPYIICSNHTSWFDPPLVGCVFSRNRLCFMAKEELFKIFILGYIITKLYAFPVKETLQIEQQSGVRFRVLEEGDILLFS